MEAQGPSSSSGFGPLTSQPHPSPESEGICLLQPPLSAQEGEADEQASWSRACQGSQPILAVQATTAAATRRIPSSPPIAWQKRPRPRLRHRSASSLLLSRAFKRSLSNALSFTLLLLAILLPPLVTSQRPPQPASRSYPYLSSSSLSSLLALSDPAPYLDHRSPDSFVSRILIPRVAGSEGIKKVRKIILDIFRKQLAPSQEYGRSGWHIEEHSIKDDTPIGRLPFHNLIFTKNPNASRRLVLAAHYDSKYFERGAFVGAIDSAAPCAMLVDVAVALDRLLEAKSKEDLTLQLIFFDGEEAFKVWTRTDSTYGSRALAANWSQTYFTPGSPPSLSPRRIMSTPSAPLRKIDAIDHLVLLDLLGSKDPNVPSYFASTDWLFKELISAEKRLAQGGILHPVKRGGMETRDVGYTSFFASGPVMTLGGIEDDHLPFLANGVPVLHLIPRPFPKVWHTLKDDASALDYPTTHAWSMLMRLFVAEYLQLDLSSPPHLSGTTKTKRHMEEKEEEEEEEDGWGDDRWLREREIERRSYRDEFATLHQQ